MLVAVVVVLQIESCPYHSLRMPAYLYACCTCSAGRLQTKYIIHTVGPVYENAEVSAPLLRQAYA